MVRLGKGGEEYLIAVVNGVVAPCGGGSLLLDAAISQVDDSSVCR